MSRLSVLPDTVGPNANELRLGKRLFELEKERDTLAVSHHPKAERRGTNTRPSWQERKRILPLPPRLLSPYH